MLSEVKQNYVCIECTHPSKHICYTTPPNILRISQCEICLKSVDKYVEYDAIIILLDAMLLKKSAFRHFLYNTSNRWLWRFALFLLLIDTFQRWKINHDTNNQSNDSYSNMVIYAAQEYDFYHIFIKCTIEYFIHFSFIFLMLNFLKMKTAIIKRKQCLQDFIKCMIFSNLGKLFVLSTHIWDSQQFNFYNILIDIYIFVCNLYALNVYCGASYLPIFLILIVAHISYYFFSFMLIL